MRVLILAVLFAISYAQTERRLLGGQAEAKNGERCKNEFTDKECRTIFVQGLCPMFYHQCQEKCGCFSDQAHVDAFRKSANIDDNLVANSDQCLPNDDTTFKDKNGFGCAVYEGAGWCNGQGEFGEGWCGWFPKALWQTKGSNDWCKISRGRDRMRNFEAYSNDATHIDARSCCCDGNLSQDYKDTYEKGFEYEDTTCEDMKVDGEQWHDDKGWTCAVYHYGNLCTPDGKRGEGWKKEEGRNLENSAFKDSTSAVNACCACGGGYREKHWATLPISTRRFDKFVNKDFHSNNIRRARKHLRSIRSYVKRHEKTKYWDPVVIGVIEECMDSVHEGKPNQESTWHELQNCWDKFRHALLESDGDSYPFLTEGQ